MSQYLPFPVKFREDINGLRAWAVIAVLLFHFSLIGLPGGFAGVDVFFVISGYLMTAVIIGSYEKGNFSIWKFYMARARRILPALMVVVTVLLALGWFWLPTSEYQVLGGQSVYGLSFLSNIYYWRSSGYFDSAAVDKWLLHTWSLAVEVQFYLLYPIFIAIVWHFWKNLKAVTIGVLLLFISSFGLNLILSGWKPNAAFYLLPARGWELTAGALVFLMAKQCQLPEKTLGIVYWVGWIMVVSSFLFIRDFFSWPSYWALLPVLGASLIILANKGDSRLTNNAIAQWLGDRSYSLYLWHWPLVVLLNFDSIQNQWVWVFGFFALSILLAHGSYHLIEMPTRRYLYQVKLQREAVAFSVMGVVISALAVCVWLFVFEGRIDSKAEVASFEAINFDPRRPECLTPMRSTESALGCSYGNGELGAILIGDSHSAAAVTAVAEAAHNYDMSIFFRGMDGCSSIMGAKWISSDLKLNQHYIACEGFNKQGLEVLKQKPSVPLIVVNRFNSQLLGPNEKKLDVEELKAIKSNLEYNSQKLISTLCELGQDREVFVVRPIPEIGIDVPKTLSRNVIFGRNHEDVKISLAQYYIRSNMVWELQDEAAQQCGVKILNPIPYLCDEGYCYGSKNGRPLYYDDDHLSEYGNKFLVPMFEEVFKKIEN